MNVMMHAIQLMRDELTSLGITELRTPKEVEDALGKSESTTMVVVNSVCGCAAGAARPAVALALQHPKRPERLYTVFAGQDKEATEKARGYFLGQPPSSPSVVLMKAGKVVHMVHRRDIEGHSAEMIAQQLTSAFERYC